MNETTEAVRGGTYDRAILGILVAVQGVWLVALLVGVIWLLG